MDHLAEVDGYIADHDQAMAEQIADARPAPTMAQLRARLEAKRKAAVQSSELAR